MDHTARPIHRGVPDQPELRHPRHRLGRRKASGQSQQNRDLTDLLGCAENIAGLSADLPLC